jgi:hypothetical protein
VAVAWFLFESEPQPDLLLKFAKGNNTNWDPVVVNVDTISLTAFVLPCIKEPTDEFSVNLEMLCIIW